VAVTKRLLNAEVGAHFHNAACGERHRRRRAGGPACEERRDPQLRGN
jgi:hypothetical protein